jgi:hypothetical protein
MSGKLSEAGRVIIIPKHILSKNKLKREFKNLLTVNVHSSKWKIENIKKKLSA